jgi:threonine dehydratase
VPGRAGINAEALAAAQPAAAVWRGRSTVVEPAGAACLAALMHPLRSRFAGSAVGAIVCGANIDAAGFCRLLAPDDAVTPP